MLKVIAQEFINPEYLSIVTPLYQELVIKTKAEPDCIAYDLFHDNDLPGHFIFIEEWPNQGALDTHVNSEHFRRLVPDIAQYARAEATFMKMSPLE